MSATLFDSDRMTMTEAIDLTVQSLLAYGAAYDHWAIAYSGGKDSSLVATIVPHLIAKGKVPAPKSVTILYADTRMELTPLQHAAMGVMNELRRRGMEARIVLPKMDDRFYVYMFGRGVPPPSNTFRWCTQQIKIDPMVGALKELRDHYGNKFLMLTGVRLGESAARDARIAVSCGKNGAECGQGWLQVATPEAVADTLAPALHWRVCLVWKWLRDYAPQFGFPTACIATAYGGDEAEEINARTGCVGCNLASRDVALDAVIENPEWQYLSPLKRLKPLYAELKKPKNRLRKDGTETRQDGSLVSNPMRMGPLTLEARRWGLGQILAIQDEIAHAARADGRPEVSLIDGEEHARILELIAANTWPRGWSGTEPVATLIHNEVMPDGSIQDDFLAGQTL